MRRYPTTLEELLGDRSFRLYFRDVYEPALRVEGSQPWMVMAEKHSGKFARGLRPTFREACELYDKILEDEQYRDASVISRGIVYPFPTESKIVTRAGKLETVHVPLYDWSGSEHSWCGRCRRPTVYRMYADGHPALRGWATVVVPNVKRCHFCGLQEGFNKTWTR